MGISLLENYPVDYWKDSIYNHYSSFKPLMAVPSLCNYNIGLAWIRAIMALLLLGQIKKA